MRKFIINWLFKNSIHVDNLLKGHIATKEYVHIVKYNIKEEIEPLIKSKLQ